VGANLVEVWLVKIEFGPPKRPKADQDTQQALTTQAAKSRRNRARHAP
jgi:hypothetical protein